MILRASVPSWLVVFVVAIVPANLGGQTNAPWFGTWQHVPPETKCFNPWPYQKVTLRIEPQDDGLRVVYDMVRRRGGITHME